MENTQNTNSPKTIYGISYKLNNEFFIMMEKTNDINSDNPFSFLAIHSPEKIMEFLINKFVKINPNKFQEQLMAFNSLNPFIVKFENISSSEDMRQQLVKYHDNSGEILGIINHETGNELFGLRVKSSINQIKVFDIKISKENINKQSWFNPFNPNKENLA